MYIPIPAGIKVGWSGTIASIPKGFLFCNGQAVSRTQFANLFAAIGTIWGVGNGTTTFNIPDCRNRVQMGADADVSCKPTTSIEGSALQCGGSTSHCHAFSGVSDSHTHTFNVSGSTSGHSHNFSGYTDTFYPNTIGVECWFLNACYPSDGNSHSHYFSGTTDSASDSFSGSGTTDSASGSLSGSTDGTCSVPPYAAFPEIIKV